MRGGREPALSVSKCRGTYFKVLNLKAIVVLIVVIVFVVV